MVYQRLSQVQAEEGSSLYDVSVDDEGGIFWPASDECTSPYRRDRFTELTDDVSTQL